MIKCSGVWGCMYCYESVDCILLAMGSVQLQVVLAQMASALYFPSVVPFTPNNSLSIRMCSYPRSLI